MVYYSHMKVKDKERPFLNIAYPAMAHLILDVVTVLTVNNLDVVPGWTNRLLHACFYLTGIAFGMAFYNYILDLTAMYRYNRILNALGVMPLFFYALLVAILPMKYTQGDGTNYSDGILAYIGYAIFMVYLTVSLFMVLAARNRLEKRVKWAVIPISVIMYITVLAQAIRPELLMTGADVTLLCVAIFVSMDNPDMDYKEQALWDYLTGLKNRNCYSKDMAMYAHRAKQNRNDHRMGILVADLNNLKVVNDTYGHVEGDRLIANAAAVLRTELKTAQGVYRLGGDEFAAVYLAPDEETVKQEMEQVAQTCIQSSDGSVCTGIALGYACGNVENSVEALFHVADRKMYENKFSMKKDGGALTP